MPGASSQRKLTPNQQARRSRILTAAQALLGEHGYDGMIMRDVAARAGVSPTTLYNLYNTKDELLLEALRESVAESWQRAVRAVPQLGMNRLIAQMHESVQQTREAPTFSRAISQALFRASEGDAIVRVLVQGNTRAVAASLKQMVDDGELTRQCDLDGLARSLVGTFWAHYHLWNIGQLDLDALETELTRCLLSMLLPFARGSARVRITQHFEAGD